MSSSKVPVAPVRRAGRALAQVPAPATAAAPAPADGVHLLFGLLFGFGLVTGLELWWLGTPAGSITTVGDVLTAAGRVAGMISGFVLLTQLLLTSRLGWLECGMGTHALLAWHRWLGAVLVVAVSGHVAATVVGYAAATGASVTGQAWVMLSTYEDLLGAFAAAGLLVVVGISSVRAIRRVVPYELWRWLHLTGYLVVWLGYGHQFAHGQELASDGFGRWYWAGLHVLVAGAVVWGRLVSPSWRNLRHRFRVLEVVPETSGVVSIYVDGRRLERLDASGGQFFRWRFLARGCWWQSHPFSLSAAPNRRWLRLTVKAVGRHTAGLQLLAPGVRVVLHGPFGVFTARRRRRARVLLIAAGSGIAPVRALLEDLPPEAVVIYRARSEADLLFRAELDRLARHRQARVCYLVGGRDDPGPRRLLTPAGLRGLVPDVRRRDVYLCGPAGVVTAALATLRRLRVPRRQIHLDPFEL
jgi:predicted ferric reductase